MLKKQDQRLMSEKISFLESLPPLNLLSRSQLKKFAKNLRSKMLHRHEYLFRQGDKADYIYIVREGEFSVTLRYDVQGPSFFETKQMEVFENPSDAKRHDNPLNMKNSRKEHKNFFLNMIQNRIIVGLEDIVLQSQFRDPNSGEGVQNFLEMLDHKEVSSYTTSVQCTS